MTITPFQKNYNMKYRIPLLLLLFILSFARTSAQNSDSTLHYPILIKFQSQCCGVPDEKPLIKAIAAFKKKYHIKKITTFHIGPMGREGEYYIGLPLKEMNRSLRIVFIKKIKKVCTTMKEKGTVECEENATIINATLPSRATIEKIKI